LLVKHSSLVVM